ncbi:cytochrome P450 [Ramaria rubella]|nr:cytochrome P450 [Ramaria rubella]
MHSYAHLHSVLNNTLASSANTSPIWGLDGLYTVAPATAPALPDPALRTPLLLLAGILLVLLTRYLTRPDPLGAIPGPWLARHTALLLAYHTRRGKRYLYVDKLHKQYGPHVRLTPTQISCAAPSAPSTIYAQGALSLPKAPFYRAFYVDGTPSLFSTQDRAGHAAKRRVLAHPFSAGSVRGFEGWIRGSVGRMVGGLDGVWWAGERDGSANGGDGGEGRIDILMWLNYLAFDVISDLAFGAPLGMLARQSDVLPTDDEEDEEEADEEEEDDTAMIDYRGRTAAYLGLLPSLLPFGRWIPDGFVRRGLRGTESLSKIARRCVRTRLASPTQERRGDLLDRLVEGMGRGGGDGEGGDGEVREEDVVTEAMLLLTAGSDTTANSTAAVLFHVLRSPRVLGKLRAELDAVVGGVGVGADEAVGDGDADADGRVIPWHDQIKSLKYLQATIDEGLRLFATNAFGLPRVVPEGGRVVVGGRAFGEGTELSAPAWTIQHDPAIWGDPEVFRPERWLESGASELKRHLLTFGMGPRACIGKNLAYMQMQLLIATLVRRYDMDLCEDELRSVEGFMHKPVEVWVRIRRRNGAGLGASI